MCRAHSGNGRWHHKLHSYRDVPKASALSAVETINMVENKQGYQNDEIFAFGTLVAYLVRIIEPIAQFEQAARSKGIVIVTRASSLSSCISFRHRMYQKTDLVFKSHSSLHQIETSSSHRVWLTEGFTWGPHRRMASRDANPSGADKSFMMSSVYK